MTATNHLLTAGARSIQSLAPTVLRLAGTETEARALLRLAARARRRGYFTPGEDDAVRARFAQYLTAREGLRQTIHELAPLAEQYQSAPDREGQLRGFLLGYTAACLLVHGGRHLIEQWSADAIIRRKLDEAEPRYRIPRKQYTAIYRGVTSPINAWRLRLARRYAQAHRDELGDLRSDPQFGPIVEFLDAAEPSIAVSSARYLLGRLGFRRHSFRRRRASAWHRVMFQLLEVSGRIVAEMRAPWHTINRADAVRDELAKLLQPGDVIVTRHDQAMSNLFLPGYWPHTSLYVGQRELAIARGIRLDDERLSRWTGDRCVLEARKDGVLLRPLHDTLAVDAVAVLRPRLAPPQMNIALQRILEHEGKLYNFDFDFFRSDRLVCTEVIYRAFDGLGGIKFKLVRRQSRLTLAAEDIVRMALPGRGFDAVALYGAPTCETQLLQGAEAARALDCLSAFREIS